MAALICGGNIGGIIGSNIFLEKEAPKYWTGYGVCLGVSCLAIISTVILWRAYNNENGRRDRMTEAEIRGKYSEAQLARLGDRSSYFRYAV